MFLVKKGPIHTLFTALGEKWSKTRGVRGGSAPKQDLRPSQATPETEGNRTHPVSCDSQMVLRAVVKRKKLRKLERVPALAKLRRGVGDERKNGIKGPTPRDVSC